MPVVPVDHSYFPPDSSAVSLPTFWSSPPPRAPFCLNSRTVRFLAHLFGFGLDTVPDRSVPWALIVTVVGALLAPAAYSAVAMLPATASASTGTAIRLLLTSLSSVLSVYTLARPERFTPHDGCHDEQRKGPDRAGDRRIERHRRADCVSVE